MTTYEMAKQYYPRLWDINRLEALVGAGRLTEQERYKIVNDDNRMEETT